MREGEDEGTKPHHRHPRPDPARLTAAPTPAQVTDRQQADEGGYVVAAGDEAGVGGPDPEPANIY